MRCLLEPQGQGMKDDSAEQSEQIRDHRVLDLVFPNYIILYIYIYCIYIYIHII